MDNSIYITFMRHGRFRADDEEVNEGRYDSLLTDVGRHRFRSWRMNHAPTPPIANPIAGPSTSSFRRNDTHCPPPPTSPVATAISTRITGSATMSFIPASILRTWAHGAGNSMVSQNFAKYNRIGRRQNGTAYERYDPAESDQQRQRHCSRADYQCGSRAQNEGRDEPTASEFLDLKFSGV